MTRALRTAALALCMGALVSVARAEPAAEERARAEREFAAGLEAAARGDLEEARASFAASRAREPKPTTLLNLTLIDMRLGLYGEALGVLDELDALLQKPMDPSQRERLAARAAELRSDVEHAMRVERSPAPAAPPPEPPVRALVPAPAAPVGPAPLQRGPAPEPGHGSRAPRLLLTTSLVLSVSAALSGGLWWRAVDRNYGDCHRADGAECEELPEITRQRRAAAAVTLSLTGAAAALGVGTLVWLLSERRGGAVALTITPALSTRSVGLSAQGHF